MPRAVRHEYDRTAVGRELGLDLVERCVRKRAPLGGRQIEQPDVPLTVAEPLVDDRASVGTVARIARRFVRGRQRLGGAAGRRHAPELIDETDHERAGVRRERDRHVRALRQIGDRGLACTRRERCARSEREDDASDGTGARAQASLSALTSIAASVSPSVWNEITIGLQQTEQSST